MALRLVRVCVAALDAPVSAATTLDIHADRFLDQWDNNSDKDLPLTEHERVFVRQVIFGAERYDRLLRETMTRLYNESRLARRSELTLYRLLTYLAVVRLDELGTEHFIALVDDQDSLNMHVLLSFLFNDATLTGTLREGWCRLYDEGFVDNELIGGLQRHRVQLTPFLEALASRVGCLEEAAVARDAAEKAGQITSLRRPTITLRKKPPTKVKPFSLTERKPVTSTRAKADGGKGNNTSDEGSVRSDGGGGGGGGIIRARPVPSSTYHQDVALEQAIEAAKEDRRLARLKDYQRVKPFSLATRRPSAKSAASASSKGGAASDDHQQQYQQHQQRQQQQQQHVKQQRRRSAANTDPEIPVRMNLAAILREDAFYKQKQDKEAKLIREYEQGLHDLSQHEQWLERERKREERERLEIVERRRVELQLSAHEAAEARERQAEENRLAAEALRLEAEKLRALRAEEEKQEIEHRRSLKDSVKACEDNARQRLDLLAKEKAAAVAAMAQQRRQVAEETARLRAAELAQKQALIQQIRAMENRPRKVRVKVDVTETSGAGTLEEMSIAEVRVRLEQLKKREEEERAARRDEIVREKMRREEEVRSKLSDLARYRSMRQQELERKRAERQAQVQAEKQERTEMRQRKVVELQQRLQAKREARRQEQERLAKERDAARKKSAFFHAAYEEVEEKKFRELEGAQQRSALQRQVAAKQNALQEMQDQAYELKTRQAYLKKQDQKRLQRQSEYNKTLRANKAFAAEEELADASQKRATVRQVRATEATGQQSRKLDVVEREQ